MESSTLVAIVRSKTAAVRSARRPEDWKAKLPSIRYTGLGFRFLDQFAPLQDMQSEAEKSKCGSPPLAAERTRSGGVESSRWRTNGMVERGADLDTRLELS